MNTRKTLCLSLLLLVSGAAAAQTEFQLPRECSDRQLADRQKCVIQDGPPPRAPWVHRAPIDLNAGSISSPGNAVVAPSPAPGRFAPRR